MACRLAAETSPTGRLQPSYESDPISPYITASRVELAEATSNKTHFRTWLVGESRGH